MKADWKNYCSPVRDQGPCGSCASFGTIGAWEALLRIKAGDESLDVDLSERDLFACSGGMCDRGNTMKATFERALIGVPSEECCPYEARDIPCGDQRCKEWWVDGKKLASWREVKSISEMKSLLDDGPLVGVMAVHQSFLQYRGGVYHHLGPEDPIIGYHCITIIGYEDEFKAWLLRNSWGIAWGMDGYCWIRYGDSEVDEVMYFIELDGPIEPDKEVCFIKTALQGTSKEKDLQKIRRFRDNHLNPNALSRRLVTAYYNILSPPIAKLVLTSALSRQFVRALLMPIITAIKLLK